MSSKQIQVFYELEIIPGKADELLDIARQMVAFNDAGEPNTQVYNVYINDDQTLLTYWETHADSAAMLYHAERFANGDFIGQVVERTQGARLCFYGDVSDEMKTWVIDNGFEVEYFDYVDGFTH